METTNQNEQGAGRIAAALSASLKALSEVQEAQKRIEDRLDRLSDLASRDRIGEVKERLGSLESAMGRRLEQLTRHVVDLNSTGEALGRAFEESRKEKKPVRWKHHLRAGGLLLGALGIGLMAGWLWALSWLRVDETARMVMENNRLSMENQRLSFDDEREIGRAVMVNYGHADQERRQLISLLISSDEMSKNQRRRTRKWLKAQAKKPIGRRPGK